MWQHRLESTLDLPIRYDQVSRVCDRMVDKIDWVADDAGKLKTKGRSANAVRERTEVLIISKALKHFLAVQKKCWRRTGPSYAYFGSPEQPCEGVALT